jgi:hypothetical protein
VNSRNQRVNRIVSFDLAIRSAEFTFFRPNSSGQIAAAFAVGFVQGIEITVN